MIDFVTALMVYGIPIKGGVNYMSKVTLINVERAVEISGLKPQAIRCGLKSGVLPFGFAFKGDKAKNYSYRIIEERLLLWLKGKL